MGEAHLSCQTSGEEEASVIDFVLSTGYRNNGVEGVAIINLMPPFALPLYNFSR